MIKLLYLEAIWGRTWCNTVERTAVVDWPVLRYHDHSGKKPHKEIPTHTKTHCSVIWSSSIFVDYNSKWKSKLKVNESLWGQMQLLFVWSTNVFASGRWKGKIPEILYLNILKVIRDPSEKICKKKTLIMRQSRPRLHLAWEMENSKSVCIDFLLWEQRRSWI